MGEQAVQAAYNISAYALSPTAHSAAATISSPPVYVKSKFVVTNIIINTLVLIFENVLLLHAAVMVYV